ncbi:hypothetical protein SLE2022_321770 [Rubroshorea leprosula]
MELLVEPIVELVKCLGRSACTYLDYHSKFNEVVSDLRRECEVLNSQKEEINSKVQTEFLWGRKRKREVESWLHDVQQINDEVDEIEGEILRVKWYLRGHLGKLVCRKIEAVKKIRVEGCFPDGLVVDRPPTHGVIMSNDNPVGEDSAKEKIRGYLVGNEVRKIGVCGIGGVGKTTIMKHINDELVREAKFDKVIWVTVSYPLDVIKLQENIAHAITEDDTQRLLGGEDKERRAAELKSVMGRVRHVLILDDVWEVFSLIEVGIPEPTIQNGSKIVITSRSIDLCQKMDCEIVKVEPLSFQESFNLFLDKVGQHVLQIPDLEGIFKLIVEECGGLPLAIVVIAESMKGEDDVHVWKNALTELQEGVKSVTGSDQKIFKRLRFSYDRLNNFEIQSCFLYCSLFPEDYPFQIEGLVEGWIDEGLIDVLPSRKAAYDRGHAFLNMLVKKCLLEKTVTRYGDDGFKMHDVMRDMAIQSIGPEFGYMVKARMKLTEVPEEHGWGNDLKKVSLMENKISKIPLGLCPKCPTLSTLILSNNQNLSEIPESFFEGMPELKVLDLSETGIEALPNSISNLEKLSSMRLRWCKRLRYLPSLAKLRALKKLDLGGSGIEVVPQGMEKLTSLEYLDLSYCENLEESPVGMLSNLSKLQYLSVYAGLEIKGEEVAGLKKLETFECEFDDIQGYNHFVNSQDFRILTDYGIAVGPFGSEPDDGIHQSKPVVKIHHWNLGDERIVLPDNLKNLKIERCGNMRSGLNKADLLEKATELRSCFIRDCEDMECVVDLNSSSCPVLDKLEELYLSELPELSVLVRVEGLATPPHVFSNLKKLQIRDCSGMRKLLPLELLQAFQNLEEIEVDKCWYMEEIIASSDSDESPDEFTFPKLRRLQLMDLPQLKSICSAKGVMVCDSIEEIWIFKCRELKRIPVQLPLLDNGQPSPPPHLRRIMMDRDAEEWWESVEWDHKNLFQAFLVYLPI